jgi:hypothetical protein
MSEASRATVSTYHGEFEYGQAVEVFVAGEWRRGTAFGSVMENLLIGRAVAVDLEGENEGVHLFWIYKVRPFVEPEPDYKEIVLKAIAWAHCNATNYNGCAAVEEWLNHMHDSDEDVRDLYKNLAYGLIDKEDEDE